jgi:hypothetical protein
VRSRSGHERGSITAEFATIIPAVMVVLACCLGAMRLAGEQLQLQGIAVAAARAVARGDAAPDAAYGSASLLRADHDGLVCITASKSEKLGLLGTIRLKGTSCALE